jgi:hypothetical protein
VTAGEGEHDHTHGSRAGDLLAVDRDRRRAVDARALAGLSSGNQGQGLLPLIPFNFVFIVEQQIAPVRMAAPCKMSLVRPLSRLGSLFDGLFVLSAATIPLPPDLILRRAEPARKSRFAHTQQASVDLRAAEEGEKL